MKNLLLILTDQQRFDTIASLGNPIIKTPQLDSMVKRGTSFTNAYTTCPICVPARYSILSGLMPHQSNCTANEHMQPGNPSLMELLRDNGYQTHGVGKMHFTFPDTMFATMWGFESRDFSEENATRFENADYFQKFLEDNGYGHVKDPHGVRSEMYMVPQPSQLPERLHETTWVVDRSIDFLKRRDKSRPFFLMSNFIKPHPPFESPTPWNKLYRGPEMPLPKRPANTEDILTYWNHFQNRFLRLDQGRDDNLIRIMKAAYYCSISFIDYNLGRLFAYLDENNLTNDTTIIFTSDHGEFLGDYDCYEKRSFLDSAARVPMIVMDRDMPKDTRCDVPVSLIDIFPTFMEKANIKTNIPNRGESLTNVINGKSGRDFVYGQFSKKETGLYGAVTKDYKYMYSAADEKEYFFDRNFDPLELENKAYNGMYIKRKLELKNKLIKALEADNYNDAVENGDWKKYGVQKLRYDVDRYQMFQDPPDSLPNIAGYERSYSFVHEEVFSGVSLHLKNT